MKTTITIDHGTDNILTGRIDYEGGKMVELWPGGRAEVFAQIHAALAIGPLAIKARLGWIGGFQQWSEHRLKQAANLQAPRYCVDRMLEGSEPRRVPHAVYMKLIFFPDQKLLPAELTLMRAIEVSDHMMGGFESFLDSGHFALLVNGYAAMKEMNAVPYVGLLEDVFARLERQLINIFDPSTHIQWYQLPPKPEEAVRGNLRRLSQDWWKLDDSPETSFSSYALAFLQANLATFQLRCRKTRKTT